jgi:hypothetical protein
MTLTKTAKPKRELIELMMVKTKTSDFGGCSCSVVDYSKPYWSREQLDSRIRKGENVEEQIRSAREYYEKWNYTIIDQRIESTPWLTQVVFTAFRTAYEYQTFPTKREAEQYVRDNWERLYYYWLNPETLNPEDF